MPGRTSTPVRQYPVGIPVKPPAGWRPRAAAPRPAVSPFRSQVTLVLRTLLLSLLVIVCMGIGWFLVNGRRPARSVSEALAKTDRKKRDTFDPKSNPIVADDSVKKKPESAPIVKAKRELTYEKDVMPILERSCISCHTATKKKGGLDLRTYRDLVKGGDSGAGLVPGKPDDSPLYDTVATNRMPPGSKKLTAEERETIRAWIASGAKSER